MAKGSWRRAARQTLNVAYLDVPPEATRKEARTILSAAYPFGERKHHPYKAWLAELKEFLDECYGKPETKKETAPQVVYSSTRRPTRTRREALWLVLACGWCKNALGIEKSCLMCLRYWQTLEPIISDPLFLALRDAEAARDDPVAGAALGDYLEERLGVRCGL